MQSVNTELLDFIYSSPTAFHAVDNIKHILIDNGYVELDATMDSPLKPGGKYFTVRNGSAIAAFRLPEDAPEGFGIVAAHLDSPCFKVKENAVVFSAGLYSQLNVERYGGMIMSTWMDRPLSAAGRVIIEQNNRLVSRLVDFKEPVCVIPNVAIHMNRNINDGFAINPAVDMLPLLGGSETGADFDSRLAEKLGVDKSSIVAREILLYPSQRGVCWGGEKEYISSARLDDLQCAFGCLKGFLAAGKLTKAAVFCAFDNEEVGSGTRQGADSDFLSGILSKIAEDCAEKPLPALVANSFLVSADNAHAIHPNHPEYADKNDRPVMNGGIVIKYNANQLYTTDAVSAAVFNRICARAGVPVQRFTNRADMRGGSTLGHISSAHVAVASVDIGLAQLAMHSAWETAGARDTEYLLEAIKTYYEAAIRISTGGIEI